MDAPARPHPTDQTLHDYGLGKLDGRAADSIDEHLEDCADCRKRVGELSGDSFLGRLQDAHESGEPHTPDTLAPELADHPDYEILRELGRGGMGVVYLAHNRLMGRNEVLKVIGKHLVQRKTILERFLREIRSAARLQHTNIVTAYSAMRLGDSVVLAMEYVDGLDLARMVKTKGPLPVAHAAFFVHQAALGLQHAHEKGMVHRDIKPANLILARDGKKAVVKVLDFGLAKVTSERPVDGTLTQDGQMLGTPDYIAPEQTIDAQKADVRADIYSLGCTLYYLLTGGPPFQAASLYELLQAHHSMDAAPLNLARPEVPVELAALVAKMMAKEPERRFQTPAEVARALLPFFKPAAAGGLNTGRPEVKPVDQPTPKTEVESRVTRAGAAPLNAGTDRVAWESLIEFKECGLPDELAQPRLSPARAETGGRSWGPRSLAAGLLLLGLFAALAAGVLKLRTPEGTIVFENLPDQAVVSADGSTVTVEWPAGKGKSPARISLPAGKHSVRVELNGVVVSGAEVVVDAGGEAPFVVRRETPVMEAPPTPAPEAKDVGRATFDPARFSLVDEGAGRWYAEDQELVVTRKNQTIVFPRILFGDNDWTDYDFSVDAMRVEGLFGFGLIFRSSRAADDFDYLVQGSDWKASALRAHQQGEREQVLQKDPTALATNRWYTARVRVRGKHVQCFLRDGAREVKLFDVENDRHPNGRVGLVTFWSGYRFKNIKVTAADGKTLWQGPPAIGPKPLVETPPDRSLKTVSNTVGMTLKLIPAGSFTMGAHDDEPRPDGPDGSTPRHEVRISRPFYLGAHEVTQEQYQKVVGRNPSAFGGLPNLPVESVSWDDAVAFCIALSVREGRRPYYHTTGATTEVAGGDGYRLPTEAEWEYACRAGTTTRYSYGDNPRLLSDHAWIGDWSGDAPHPVGLKPPNGFGLLDMHGNVAEWCWDWFAADTYQPGSVDDPTGPRSGLNHVHRGGTFLPRDRRLHQYTSAHRGGQPGIPRNSRPFLYGFRVACDAVLPEQGTAPQARASESRN